jgi:hypothetical protein
MTNSAKLFRTRHTAMAHAPKPFAQPQALAMAPQVLGPRLHFVGAKSILWLRKRRLVLFDRKCWLTNFVREIMQ